MTIPSLFRSASNKIETKKQPWPDPQLSVGQRCFIVSGLQCREVTGPALNLMNNIGDSIKELLQNNIDLMQQGEDKATTMSFDMWMVGHDVESSVPTIVFSSKSCRQRKFAKALLQESRILEDHPGIRIRTQEKTPAVFRTSIGSENSAFERTGNTDIYLDDARNGPCGALLCIGQDRSTTMSGVVKLGDQYHAIVPQHAFLEVGSEPPDSDRRSGCFDFDEDSDLESDENVDITSKASVSSDSDVGSIQTSEISSESHSIFDETSDVSEYKTQIFNRDPPSKSSTYMRREKLASISSSFVVGPLDYEIFPLEASNLCQPNQVRVSEGTGEHLQTLEIRDVIQQPHNGPIIAMTGTTGSVRGSISQNPSYLKMAGCATFQEMWQVELERPTVDGDSGSWVLDAKTGGVYGHIVAGDPSSKTAFIVPAYRVFKDIEIRFGNKPELPVSQNAVTVDSSVTDDPAPHDAQYADLDRQVSNEGFSSAALPKVFESQSAFEAAPKRRYAPGQILLPPYWKNLLHKSLWGSGLGFFTILSLLLFWPSDGYSPRMLLFTTIGLSTCAVFQRIWVSEPIYYTLKQPNISEPNYKRTKMIRLVYIVACIAVPRVLQSWSNDTCYHPPPGYWPTNFQSDPKSLIRELHPSMAWDILGVVFSFGVAAISFLFAIPWKLDIRQIQALAAFKVIVLFVISLLGILASAKPESLHLATTRKPGFLWQQVDFGAYYSAIISTGTVAVSATNWILLLLNSRLLPGYEEAVGYPFNQFRIYGSSPVVKWKRRLATLGFDICFVADWVPLIQYLPGLDINSQLALWLITSLAAILLRALTGLTVGSECMSTHHIRSLESHQNRNQITPEQCKKIFDEFAGPTYLQYPEMTPDASLGMECYSVQMD